MALHPELAVITARIPASPPLAGIDVVQYRARLNQASASSPKLDVPLAEIFDRTIPGPAGDIPVRVYVPEGDGPFPLLVYYHGGGYVIGNLDTSDAICRSLAAGSRCVVMSVDYRLAPEHRFPAGVEDAWASLRWAADHAGEIKADGRRLAVGGDSAGGNFAAAVAIQARDAGIPLVAQLLLYCSPNFPDPNTESAQEFPDGPLLRAEDSRFYWGNYLADIEDRHDPRAAPARAERHDGLAPAFVASAQCDPSRDLGERYAVQLQQAGNIVEARRYDGMPHGFLAFVAHSPAVQSAMSEISDWLASRWLNTQV